MLKRLIWILCFCLPLLSVGAQGLKRADAAQSKAMIERINKTASGIRSIDCQFTQVKTLRFLDDEMTSEGRMLFMADGGRLRWEYQRPYSYTFVLNGDKAYMRSGQGRQQTVNVSQSRLFQGIAEVMMNSVTGKGLTTSSDFSCQMYTSGDEWQAVLTPKRKEMKKLFKDVTLHFSSTKQMATKVVMTEQSGDTTVITLKNVKTNGRVDEKMFAAL